MVISFVPGESLEAVLELVVLTKTIFCNYDI